MSVGNKNVESGIISKNTGDSKMPKRKQREHPLRKKHKPESIEEWKSYAEILEAKLLSLEKNIAKNAPKMKKRETYLKVWRKNKFELTYYVEEFSKKLQAQGRKKSNKFLRYVQDVVVKIERFSLDEYRRKNI